MNRLLVLLFFILVTVVSSNILAIRPKLLADITSVLPEDTLALIEWDNFSRSLEGWQRCPIGDNRHHSLLFKGIVGLGFPEALVEELRNASTFIEPAAKKPSFQHLSSHKAVLALLPPSPGSASLTFPLYRHFVLVLQQDEDGPLLQSLQDILGFVRFKQSTTYQGESLKTLVFEGGQTLTYWVGKGVVICAQDSSLVQRCIDQALQRMVRERVGIQLNAFFERLQQYSQPGSDAFLYANFENLQYYLPSLRGDNFESSGLLPRHLALYHRADDGSRNRFGFAALVDKDALSAFTAQHQLPPPVKDPPSLRVFQETELSLWSNWLQPKKLWDLGMKANDPEVSALMATVAQQFSEAMGTSVDTFFHVFGSGFGVFINNQAAPHQSNRAMGCLAIEVRDRTAVLAMIKQLVKGLQVITVKSGDTEISSVVLAGGLLQPAYAVVDNYLILADSVELIEQARQQLKPYRNGVQEHLSWTKGREGNLFVFVRTGDMVDRLLPILTLVAKETGEPNRILQFESRRFLREIGLPLLTRLRSVATTYFHGYVAEETIFLEVDCSLRRE